MLSRIIRTSIARVAAIPAAAFVPAAAAVSCLRYGGTCKAVDQEQFKTPMPPVVNVSGDKNTKDIEVSWRQCQQLDKFSNEISSIFAPYGVKVNKQCVEGTKAKFSVSASSAMTDAQWKEVISDISHVAAVPKAQLGRIAELPLTRKQQSFAFLGWKFAHQFVNRYDDDYHAITSILNNVPGNGPKVLLNNLKRRMRQDTFNEANVMNAITNNVEIVKEIYNVFDARFNPSAAHPTEEAFAKSIKDLDSKITKTVQSELEVQVLQSMTRMINSMKKTNFYRDEKVAISTRLDGKFLNPKDYPATPYGVFFIVGPEFRGFHVRFADIARGGIRVIKSPTRQAYANNVSTVFDENYNLAYTQQKKNKDIPEGGSKGTILLNPENQEAGELSFQKYVCSLMDILVPECVQVDYCNRATPEILFLGPDEYTADHMAWAVDYTKTRNYAAWKAVTTGKPPAYGGVPHDTYGMTTRSVHQCVLGILAKLNVPEESITKFQTGGPDGDLGSNEITISKDTIIGMVDGSGVVCDTEGLNREELTRLADERVMVRAFDKTKLSPKGFFVDVNDKNVTLPDGTVVEDGMAFRNNFHLNTLSSADLFVPCGGRPESINMANLPQILDKDGKCKWKYLVEGANLFCTQQARLELEKLGVILIKDASANKGGVTSSSKEVTAALSLTDEDFQKHMKQQPDGTLPEFYKSYVKDIIEIVEQNARNEFECLWEAHKETGLPFAELTDKVSLQINAIADGIGASTLFENKNLRDVVFTEYVPKTLLGKVGLAGFYKNCPVNYQQAIFQTHLACEFVYKGGYTKSLDPFNLMNFIKKYEAKKL